MNKEQFKLQAEHNRYMRGIAASICKIYLWVGIYAFAIWATMSIGTHIATEESVKVLTSSRATSDDGQIPIVIAGVLVVMYSVLFGILLGHEVGDKIKEHKRISKLEDQYFGVATMNDNVNKEEGKKIKEVIDVDEDKYDDDI